MFCNELYIWLLLGLLARAADWYMNIQCWCDVIVVKSELDVSSLDGALYM
jgi:hypothetical protein